MMLAKRKVLAGVVAALIAAMVVLALARVRSARELAVRVAAAKEEQVKLAASRKAWEEKVRRAERRALESERDASDLLKAMTAVKKTTEPSPTAARDAARVPVQGTVASSTASANPEEAARLAQERAYQQDLAKKRAEEAKARAHFDIATHALDPVARFHALLKRAKELADNAEFRVAIRTYNEAMAAKPAELPMPEAAQALQTTLRVQNTPVDVQLLSDGETYVSIQHVRAPARFTATMVKLLPDDYEVVGRRKGYREVTVRLQVRGDRAPQAVTAICTEPAGP